MCKLCNCNKCNPNNQSNKSASIPKILESFLNDSISEDLLNISTNNEDIKLIDTINKNDESTNITDISSTTMGTYIQQNITVVKVKAESSNQVDSEDVENQKVSNTVMSSVILST